MKHTPKFEDEHFYHVDLDESRSAKSWIYEDESPTGVQGFAQNFFKGFWMPPVKGNDDEPIIWTSLFLKKLAGEWFKSPLGFTIKLGSLTLLPIFWSSIIWLFATFAFGEGRPTSCYAATFAFLWTVRDSVLCLSARPSLRDFIGLLFHEAAINWLMLCVGVIVYLYEINVYGADLHTAKRQAMVAAVFTYLQTLPRVANRDGADQILPYLRQALTITCTTCFFTFLGFALTFVLKAPTWKCWSMAFFFGFVSFWIAVNLFYWPTGWEEARRAFGEPIIQE